MRALMLESVYEWSGMDYLHSSIDFKEVGVCHYHEVVLLKRVDLDQQLACTVDDLERLLRELPSVDNSFSYLSLLVDHFIF